MLFSKLPWLVLTPALVFVFVGVFAPFLMTHDPAAQDYSAILTSPSLTHWLGTDYLGRDLWSRIVGGARTSLVAMAFVLIAALVIGVIIGSIAGYVGGLVETVLISLIDIALALPSLVIALALMGVFSGENFDWLSDYWKMVLALTLAWWANYARMSRAVVIAELQQPYIEAARVMGASHLWIFYPSHPAPCARPCRRLRQCGRRSPGPRNRDALVSRSWRGTANSRMGADACRRHELYRGVP